MISHKLAKIIMYFSLWSEPQSSNSLCLSSSLAAGWMIVVQNVFAYLTATSHRVIFSCPQQACCWTELLSLAKKTHTKKQLKQKNSTMCELPDNRQQSFFPVLDDTDSIGRSWLSIASLIPFSEVESEPSRKTLKSKEAVMGDCLFKACFARSLNNSPPLPLPTHRQRHCGQQQR